MLQRAASVCRGVWIPDQRRDARGASRLVRDDSGDCRRGSSFSRQTGRDRPHRADESAAVANHSASSRRTPGSITTGGNRGARCVLQRAPYNRRGVWIPGRRPATLRVAGLAGTTPNFVGTVAHSRTRCRVRVLLIQSPSPNRGCRESRASTEARGPPAEKMQAAGTTGPAGSTRPSLRDGFTAASRSPRCPGCLVTVACATLSRRRRLDTGFGVSGPRDLTVRTNSFVGAIAHAANRPAHHIPHSTLRDDRAAPLVDEAG